MGCLVQVHKVHVDGGPWKLAIELRVQMQEGFANDLRPAIHIFAGEKVCIQSTRPMQFLALLASAELAYLSLVVSTGLKTSLVGIAPSASREAAILCEFLQPSREPRLRKGADSSNEPYFEVT